jgi:anaerobic magnesium-protoporphyrin IX monomethyl ester cyclase
MKVCLITPPSPFLLDQRVFPSLGILKVGASLKLNGHQVDHLDLSGVSNYLDTVTAYLASPNRAGTFALTATTPQMPAAVMIGERIREYGAKSILGGPHVTLVAAARRVSGSSRIETAWDKIADTFDVLVAGDGEESILAAIQMGRGFVNADDPKSGMWLTSKKFTESPWPDRGLIDVESYKYSIEGEGALHLVAQLGCPFGCGFCGGRSSNMLRRVRLRDTGNVVAEIESLYLTYGLRGFMLNDDELNVNRECVPLMHAIAALGEKYGVEWKLRGFVKAELFTDEQAAAMYRAGFRWLLCGFEGAHPRVLKNIQKRATVEDNSRMLEIARRHGIKVKALMSVGHPGESEESVLAVRDWLIRERVEDFDVTVITTYPGTPYYDSAVDMGGGVWRYTINGDNLYMEDADFTTEAQYYKGTPGSYKSYVWTDHLSQKDLVRLRDQVEDQVRKELNLPFYATGSSVRYEASMGQLPGHILRQSEAAEVSQ